MSQIGRLNQLKLNRTAPTKRENPLIGWLASDSKVSKHEWSNFIEILRGIREKKTFREICFGMKLKYENKTEYKFRCLLVVAFLRLFPTNRNAVPCGALRYHVVCIPTNVFSSQTIDRGFQRKTTAFACETVQSPLFVYWISVFKFQIHRLSTSLFTEESPLKSIRRPN